MAESDSEFVRRIAMTDLMLETVTREEWGRIFALARKGAEAAARIEALEAALREIATGQVIELPFIQAIARAALEERT